MKKVLVTGSSGYIGSSFIERNKNRYEFKSFSLLNEKIETINFDNVELILHCAALVHQKKFHPYEKYKQTNVDYPIKLAKLAKKNGVKQFIFISSVAVYGENVESIDTTTTCNPSTNYGKSKYEAEKCLLDLSDEDFIVNIIRIPMVYGKNAPGNILKLINLIKKSPILPFYDTQNKRSFIYIGNLCAIIEKIILHKQKGIFLTSDDTPLSTTGLIKTISKNLNKKIYLIKMPFFELFLKKLKPSLHKKLYGNLIIDNALAKKKLKFENPYTVEEGIKYMIKAKQN